MSLVRLQSNVQKLSDPNFIYRLVIDAAEVHKKALVELIKGQIRVGVKGDGKRTMKYTDDLSSYNPNYYYVKIKETKAKQFPYRNYDNTGAFLGDMFAFARDTEILVGSTDEKTAKIEGDEGSVLFELTEENKTVFAGLWIPTFIKLLRNELLR